MMTDQKNRWATIRQMLCCFAVKDAAPDPQFFTLDAAPDPQQQLSCNVADNNYPESIPDQPATTTPSQEMFEIMNLPMWEDKEAMYKGRIHDLEQELTKALKNKLTLAHHLYELGCQIFPEMHPRDSLSPSFLEKLKVYLQCLQLERQQLEKRALRAEQTVWEIQNEMSEMEMFLHSCGYRGTRRMEHWPMPDHHLSPLEAPPLHSQPRYYFPKIYRKSPENKAAVQSPRKWPEKHFGKVFPPKQSPVKEGWTKSPCRPPSNRSPEAMSYVSLVKKNIFPEYGLPPVVHHSEAGSCWPPPEHSQHSTARAFVGYGNTCVAQVHGHWNPHLERVPEEVGQWAEDDNQNATSTLQVATPSAGGSEYIKISPDISVSLDSNTILQKSKIESWTVWSDKPHLATMEGKCDLKKQGKGSESKEEECIALGSVSLKPVGLAGQVSENDSVVQTDPQKLDNPEAKTFQDVSGQATSQTEVRFPGKDAPRSGQSTSTMHSSSQTGDLEPEDASCSLDLLQRPGKELSSLELSLKADLPSASIKALETKEPLEEKRVLEDAPGLNNKTDQPIPVEENATVTFPSQMNPEELLPSDLYEALTNISVESPQSTSLLEESPSAEETAVVEN